MYELQPLLSWRRGSEFKELHQYSEEQNMRQLLLHSLVTLCFVPAELKYSYRATSLAFDPLWLL